MTDVEPPSPGPADEGTTERSVGGSTRANDSPDPQNSTDGQNSADGKIDDSTTTATAVVEPSDAFQAVGNEIRTGILSTMLERANANDSTPPSFTDLFEASAVDTTAGFAYHLDELVGPYLVKSEVGYELTYAGERIARTIAAGSYTDRVSDETIPVDDPCPFCTTDHLVATVLDNVVTIACVNCDRAVLRMGFPPGGFDAHGDAVPEAFDRHHRARIAQFRDGICPACAGRVTASVEAVDGDRLTAVDDGSTAVDSNASERPATPNDDIEPVQAVFTCRRCGDSLRCPVSLTLLDHPAVVSFYRDHDRSAREKRIWNVGREWTETPIAVDPDLICVGITLDDERLDCYVDGTVSVVATRRTQIDEDGVGSDRSADGVSTNDDDEDGSPGHGSGTDGSEVGSTGDGGPEPDESDVAEPSVDGAATNGGATAGAAAGEGAA